jgi:hypothetical protein
MMNGIEARMPRVTQALPSRTRPDLTSQSDRARTYFAALDMIRTQPQREHDPEHHLRIDSGIQHYTHFFLPEMLDVVVLPFGESFICQEIRKKICGNMDQKPSSSKDIEGLLYTPCS